MSSTDIAFNRSVKYNYSILKEFEAGIVLKGTEIRSMRCGNINLKGAYINEIDFELWIQGMHISKYKNAGTNNHDPLRTRKLLMRRKQIAYIKGKIKEAGISAVPLRVYFNNRNLVKVSVALVRGKKLHDKRQAEKKREWDKKKVMLLHNC